MKTSSASVPSDPVLSRRSALKRAGSLAALMGVLGPEWLRAFPDAAADEELVPFLGMPRTGPNRLDWESLEEWLTPQDQVFNVQHYGIPEFDPAQWRLQITGLVDRPGTFTLDELQKRPHEDQLMTLECSGNGASKGFMNAVYNSRWTGTPLKALLESRGLQAGASEVVFFGADTKEEVLREGTKRELKVEVPFGRSLAVEDALSEPLLLAWNRNGEPIEKRNGAPLRLIAPGCYGVANVKWLTRIDVRNRRYMGRYMARDYVTVRGERQDGEVVFVESSVLRMNVKSIIARVTRRPGANGKSRLRVYGAAWTDGSGIEKVEVRLDEVGWKRAKLDAEPVSKYCWRFFSLDLGEVSSGKHVLVSRATDGRGRVQPAAEDDEIVLKKTYWEAYQQWPREIEV